MGDKRSNYSTTADKLEAVYQELGAVKNLAMVAGSISDKETGNKLAQTALEKFGSVDVLINNAGIFETNRSLKLMKPILIVFRYQP